MSAGLDNIDGRVLKLAAKFVSRPLCHIFNRCLLSAVLPTQWKRSKIITILKNKNVSFNGTNSRPINILPALGKIMETIICEQIQGYFVDCNLLTKFQYAYKPCHLTATALAHMIDNWYQDLVIGGLVGLYS